MNTLRRSNIVPLAELHQRINRIYDHLYANSPIRTAGSIATEVGKVLHTAMYIESKPSYLFVGDEYQKPCFEFTQSQVKRLIRCDDGYHQEVAAGVRSQFASMNGEWTL